MRDFIKTFLFFWILCALCFNVVGAQLIAQGGVP